MGETRDADRPTNPRSPFLGGLTATIIVDQERLGANPRSTLGTTTDANAQLRILFSRLGKPHIGGPKAFSFNVASVSEAGTITVAKGGRKVKERREFEVVDGLCPRCERLGRISDFGLTARFDAGRSASEGALLIPGYSMNNWYGHTALFNQNPMPVGYSDRPGEPGFPGWMCWIPRRVCNILDM